MTQSGTCMHTQPLSGTVTAQERADTQLKQAIRDKNKQGLLSLLQLGVKPCLEAEYKHVYSSHPLYLAVQAQWTEGVQLMLEALQGAAQGDVLDRLKVSQYVSIATAELPESPRPAGRWKHCNPVEFRDALFTMAEHNLELSQVLSRFAPAQTQLIDARRAQQEKIKETQMHEQKQLAQQQLEKQTLTDMLREATTASQTISEVFVYIEQKYGFEHAERLAKLAANPRTTNFSQRIELRGSFATSMQFHEQATRYLAKKHAEEKADVKTAAVSSSLATTFARLPKKDKASKAATYRPGNGT